MLPQVKKLDNLSKDVEVRSLRVQFLLYNCSSERGRESLQQSCCWSTYQGTTNLLILRICILKFTLRYVFQSNIVQAVGLLLQELNRDELEEVNVIVQQLMKK